MGLFKRLVSLPAAHGVITRFEVALVSELRTNPGEPFQLLWTAWQAAIEPYRTQEPQLYDFHTVLGVKDMGCRVFALLPLDQGAHYAARMVASFSYPAYGETPEGQKAWAFLGNTLDAIVSNPDFYNRQFSERNPDTFEMVFRGTVFTPSYAQNTLEILLRWVQTHGVRLG